jgi:hypothetical protein
MQITKIQILKLIREINELEKGILLISIHNNNQTEIDNQIKQKKELILDKKQRVMEMEKQLEIIIHNNKKEKEKQEKEKQEKEKKEKPEKEMQEKTDMIKNEFEIKDNKSIDKNIKISSLNHTVKMNEELRLKEEKKKKKLEMLKLQSTIKR